MNTYRPGANAFSLMEVLVALGIFALGLVAVAAVFPTAIAIQSETVRDLAGQRIAANAKATIQAMARSIDPDETDPPRNYRSLTYHHDVINPLNRAGTLREFSVITSQMSKPIEGRTGYPGGVQPMIDLPLPSTKADPTYEVPKAVADLKLNAAKSFHTLFPLELRSFPKDIPQTDRRDYYWYPLIQPRDLTADQPSWVIYLMVMQRHGTEAVPEVATARIDPAGTGDKVIKFNTTDLDNDLDNDGLPDLVQPGDWILTDDGSIYQVVLADKTSITLNATLPIAGHITRLYYAAPVELGTGVFKRESRSAIVRIEQFEVVVEQP